MGSEEKKSEEDGNEGATGDKVPKRYSRKQVRMVGIVIVVAVIAVILLWGMVPEPIYEVKTVIEDIDDLDGEYINVKGTVVSWESGLSNYTLADSNNENLTIEVSHNGAFPEGFGMEATIVAKGVVKKGSLVIKMDSDEIQIGCPSKY
jgi:cytochrome c-type biogenesis protein CcmE